MKAETKDHLSTAHTYIKSFYVGGRYRSPQAAYLIWFKLTRQLPLNISGRELLSGVSSRELLISSFQKQHPQLFQKENQQPGRIIDLLAQEIDAARTLAQSLLQELTTSSITIPDTCTYKAFLALTTPILGEDILPPALRQHTHTR